MCVCVCVCVCVRGGGGGVNACVRMSMGLCKRSRACGDVDGRKDSRRNSTIGKYKYNYAILLCYHGPSYLCITDTLNECATIDHHTYV